MGFLQCIFHGILLYYLSNICNAAYEDDMRNMLQKFGKEGILTRKLTISELQNHYTEIMAKNCKGERDRRDQLVKKQAQLKLINWATVYTAKGVGTQFHNIEFDHIPPGSANPFEDGPNYASFVRQAPTLAISNFDHRSALWKICSTTSGRIMGLYKRFVRAGNHYCAIFANIYCFKDIEKYISKIERISATETAFDRYKEGFKSLVNLHYDFGKANNSVIDFTAKKASSAYCEIPSVTDKTRQTSTACHIRDTNKSEQKRLGVWYCKNVRGTYSLCREMERNLMWSEQQKLMNWLNGVRTDDDMLTECNLNRDEWENETFIHMKFSYDPENDPANDPGTDGSCINYQRNWLKTKREIERDQRKLDRKKEDQDQPSKKPKLSHPSGR